MEQLEVTPEIRVDFKEWRDKRSLSQNKLYWQWLNEISQTQKVNDEYFDSETWHEYFKKYWCPEKYLDLPVGSTSIKSTTKLDKGEMHHYLNKIEQWCMDKNINITIPINCEYEQLKNIQNN